MPSCCLFVVIVGIVFLVRWFFLYAVIEVRATATSHKDHFAWKYQQLGNKVIDNNIKIDLDLIEVNDDDVDIMTLNDRGRHFCGLLHFCTILLGGHYDL